MVKSQLLKKIVYGAFDKLIETKSANDNNVIEIFDKALSNVKPAVEVKSRRVGGATYQVPIEVRPARQAALAMRWVVESAQKRSEKNHGFTFGSRIKRCTQQSRYCSKKNVKMYIVWLKLTKHLHIFAGKRI